ncbi:hypothetical protein [Rhizobium sp. NPDC090279]|uniref:hypothetical protein n=1 Tax=Rhizobium sp. NPDC090279 TaxID=3364499 RepID=UPI00383A686B
MRKGQPQKGWAENDAGDDLAHDRWLADAHHQFAEQPAQYDKQNDLDQKQPFGRVAGPLPLGGEGGLRNRQRQDEGNENDEGA